MEGLMGYTTAIASATGQSGSEIGNMLKTLQSRMFMIGEEGAEAAGKVEKTLGGKDIGINIRKNATEFKNFEDIMSEVAAKFPTLNKVQQQNMLQVLAGTQHVGRFTALMNNWSIATEATTKALNSNGSALVENAKKVESIEGRYNTFKSTLDGLYNKMVSSDAIKSTVSGLTELLNIIDRVTNAIGGLTTILTAVFIPLLVRLGLAVGAGTLTFAGAIAGIEGMALAIGTSLLSPVGLAITAVGLLAAGIIYYVNQQEKARQKAIEFGDAQDKFNESLREFNKTLNPAKVYEMSAALESMKKAADYTQTIKNISNLRAEIGALQDAVKEGGFKQTVIDAVDKVFPIAEVILPSTSSMTKAIESKKAQLKTEESKLTDLDVLGKKVQEKAKSVGVDLSKPYAPPSTSPSTKSSGYDTTEAENARKEQEKADKEAKAEAERERKKQEAQDEAYRKKAEQEKYNSERSTALSANVDIAKESGYNKLTQAVKSYDVALSENRAIQEDSNLTLKDKLDLMNEEKDLLKGQWKAYNDLIWQKRQERDETVKSLSKFGVGTAGAGESSYLTNVEGAMKAQQDKIKQSAGNIHDEASLQAYKDEVARGEVLKGLVKTFGELNPEIAGYVINENKLTGSINKLNPEVEIANQLFKDFDKTIKSNDENMSSLKDKYDSISDTDFDTKIKAGNDLLDAQTSSLSDVNKQLAEYDEKIKSATTPEAKELYQSEKDKLTLSGAGISKGIVSTKKGISQTAFEKGESPFKEKEKAYEKASQDLEYKNGMIDEKNYKARAKNLKFQATILKGETKAISNEITRLKDDLAKTEDKDEQNRIKESISNNEKLLQEKNLKIKDLTKSALEETISGAFKKSDADAKKFDNTMTDLGNKFSLLSENDFTNKMSILSSRINETTNNINVQTKNLQDLRKGLDDGTISSEEFKEKERELKDSIEQSKISLKGENDELKNLKITREDYVKSLVRTQIETQKSIDEMPLKEKEEALALETRTKELEFYEREKKYKTDILAIEKQIYGISKDDYENNIKTKTNELEKQITALEKQNNIQKESDDRAEKTLEIEKQKTILANVQAQKNVQIYTGGKWQWVADPTKVEEEQKKLTDLTTNFTKWEKDNTFNAQKQILQDKIDSYNQDTKTKEDNYNKQSELLKTSFDKDKLIWDDYKHYKDVALEDERLKFENQYKDMDVLVANGLEQVKKTYGTKWDEIIAVVTDKTNAVEIQYQKAAGYVNPTASIKPSTNTPVLNTGVSISDFDAQQNKNKLAQSGSSAKTFYATPVVRDISGGASVLKNLGSVSSSSTSNQTEKIDISIGQIVTNDATKFVQNMRNYVIKGGG